MVRRSIPTGGALSPRQRTGRLGCGKSSAIRKPWSRRPRQLFRAASPANSVGRSSWLPSRRLGASRWRSGLTTHPNGSSGSRTSAPARSRRFRQIQSNCPFRLVQEMSGIRSTATSTVAIWNGRLTSICDIQSLATSVYSGSVPAARSQALQIYRKSKPDSRLPGSGRTGCQFVIRLGRIPQLSSVPFAANNCPVCEAHRAYAGFRYAHDQPRRFICRPGTVARRYRPARLNG